MNTPRNRVRPGSWMLLVLVAALLAEAADAGEPSEEAISPVVMVCEHGTVKSVIAALLFDREAQARGLPFRAVSRGIVLDDEIPGKIAEALSGDGFEVSDFDPAALTEQDATDSLRIVAIGSDLSAYQDHATSTIQQWDDIPPASVDYIASRDSLLAHIQALLDELEAE